MSRSTPAQDPDDDTVETLATIAVVAGAAWGAWKVGKWLFGASPAPAPAAAPPALTVVPRTEPLVVLETYDIGCFEYTFTYPEDAPGELAQMSELRQAVERAVRQVLPEELDFAVVAAPGSLHLTVMTWLRSAWDRVTGKRRPDVAGTATVDTQTLGARLRAELRKVVKHPVEAVHRAAKVIQACQLLKTAWDWCREQLPTHATALVGL